jgi:hypothetical protein
MGESNGWLYVILCIMALIIGAVIVVIALDYVGYWNLIP